MMLSTLHLHAVIAPQFSGCRMQREVRQAGRRGTGAATGEHWARPSQGTLDFSCSLLVPDPPPAHKTRGEKAGKEGESGTKRGCADRGERHSSVR